MIQTVGLLIVALCLRLLSVRSAPTVFDTYAHLYFVKEVKVQKPGPFGEIVTKVVGSTGFRQPFLWHWLVGLFPTEKVVRFQKWINAGIDALFAIVVYLIALEMGVGERMAFFMIALYLLTPMWSSRLSHGPRISSLSPRLTSEVATNMFFIVTLLPLGMPIWLVLIFGSLIAAFVVLSSKFGLQALLLLAPLTSVIVWDPVPLTAMILAVVMAASLTKGGFLECVRTQVSHLSWYFKKNLKGGMPISGRNSLSRLFEKPRSGGGNLKHLATVLYRMITLNSYTSVLIKMPVLLLGIVLYVRMVLVDTEPTASYIVGPVVVAVIVFVTINMPPLLFLGEAERYLNHVAFFIVGMAVTMAIDQSLTWLLWLIIGYGFLFWMLEDVFSSQLLPRSHRLKSAVDDSVIAHLRSLHRSTVVLAYPYSAAGGVFRIMLETQHRVVFCFTTEDEFARRFEEKYGADYPYVKLDRLDEMAAELGVAYVVAYKKALSSRGLAQWKTSGQWRKLDVGEPRYDVYQRNFEVS